jgi:hypothetical protein
MGARRKRKVVNLGEGLLHVEARGCVVNITAGLMDQDGQEVTVVEVVPDGDRFDKRHPWWVEDVPGAREYLRLRVVREGKD